jgi:DNA-binding phage protein
MSYKWKEVEGQEWANRARYNIYVIMRMKNMPASASLIEGISREKLYRFMSGQQDITLTKLALVAEGIGVSMMRLFKEIPKVRQELPMPYRVKKNA